VEFKPEKLPVRQCLSFCAIDPSPAISDGCLEGGKWVPLCQLKQKRNPPDSAALHPGYEKQYNRLIFIVFYLFRLSSAISHLSSPGGIAALCDISYKRKRDSPLLSSPPNWNNDHMFREATAGTPDKGMERT